MSLDAAFVTCLTEGTMSAPSSRRSPQVVVMTIATSETPLTTARPLLRDMPTQAPVARREISAKIGSVVKQLRTASLLPVSQKAEDMMDRLMAANVTKPTTRRLLVPRAK